MEKSGRSEVAPVCSRSRRSYPAEMLKRRGEALDLRSSRRAGECMREKKICISASGRIKEWEEDLYGFTRVVVHGVDSLCVAARRDDLNRVIRQRMEVERYGCNMKNALIYEAEDLALPCGEAGKMTSKRIKKPFVAVSVIPCTNEASGDEYDVDRAISFLKEEMSSGATFTFGKTVKTAIFTLERLFGKQFEAKEIQVFYVKYHTGGVTDSMRAHSKDANEFPIRGQRSITDYIAVINNPEGEGSSSRKRGVDVNDKARKKKARLVEEGAPNERVILNYG